MAEDEKIVRGAGGTRCGGGRAILGVDGRSVGVGGRSVGVGWEFAARRRCTGYAQSSQRIALIFAQVYYQIGLVDEKKRCKLFFLIFGATPNLLPSPLCGCDAQLPQLPPTTNSLPPGNHSCHFTNYQLPPLTKGVVVGSGSGGGRERRMRVKLHSICRV